MRELKNWIESFFGQMSLPEDVSSSISFIVLFTVAVLVIYLSVVLIRIVLSKLVRPILDRRLGDWSPLLLKNKFYYAIGFLISVFVLKSLIPVLFEDFPKTFGILNKLVDSYLIFVIIRFLVVLIRTLEDKLNESGLYNDKPIGSYFQLARLIFYIIGFILIISILLSKSPIYFIGAFGAMTAIIMLIFKDTILGIVASIQISTFDMVRVGDWVEMEKYQVNGDVLEINLNTVKIQNKDKSNATVPTYYFITESFKNWRGMQESGRRRIMRSFIIDIHSIRFADEKMMDDFEKIDLIRAYVKDRRGSKETDLQVEYTGPELINEDALTNVEIFRIYIEEYLKNRSDILPDAPLAVRQSDPGHHGLPLEVYCFTNHTKFQDYVATQAAIFNHILASAPYFYLTIFQSPTGKDITKLNESGH